MLTCMLMLSCIISHALTHSLSNVRKIMLIERKYEEGKGILTRITNYTSLTNNSVDS